MIRHTSTKPRYIPSHRLRSSRRFNKLSLHKIALESPRASAVELDMFSTKRCLTFFKIKSNVLPWAGSACSLLYRIVTELYNTKQYMMVTNLYNWKWCFYVSDTIHAETVKEKSYYNIIPLGSLNHFSHFRFGFAFNWNVVHSNYFIATLKCSVPSGCSVIKDLCIIDEKSTKCDD